MAAVTADVRKLLAASRKSRRINSPYASYSLAGALFCNICNNQPIKSESLWDAHVQSATHKANVTRRGGVPIISTSKSSDGAGQKRQPQPPSKKRPAESSTERVHDEGEEESHTAQSDRNGSANGNGTTSSKRLKTAGRDLKNLALPVGFFDDDDDDEGGIVSEGKVILPDDDDDGEEYGDDEEPEVIEAPPEASSSNSRSGNSSLPSDFFDKTKKTDEEKLDDEWEAFQAEVAKEASPSTPTQSSMLNSRTTTNNSDSNHNNNKNDYTISAPAMSASDIAAQSTQPAADARTLAEEEMDEARDATAAFFEEQRSMEERVQKLKEKREMLRRQESRSTAGGRDDDNMQLDRSNSIHSVKMTDAPQDGEDEDDEDEDDIMFFRGNR